MELPAEVLIHNELLGVKGGNGDAAPGQPGRLLRGQLHVRRAGPPHALPDPGHRADQPRSRRTPPASTWRSNADGRSEATERGQALRQRRPRRDPAPGAARPATPTRSRRRGSPRRRAPPASPSTCAWTAGTSRTRDVERLRESVRGKLNLEMSTAEEMLKVALRVRPDQVTLVPERPEEVTTEGGLDLILYGRRIAEVAEQLDGGRHRGLPLHRSRPPRRSRPSPASPGAESTGFEINTDAYTRAADPAAARGRAGQGRRGRGARARAAGLHLYAGHGLTDRQRRPDRRHPRHGGAEHRPLPSSPAP